ncbi:MAG: 4-hydroxy-tetrahydrodipicolinate synthase [Limnospira sp. PMC 1286.21]|uniref:4-hydroxy-tetrahydrodipicolinate synthase n=1 Tax=Limnospira fusiformis PMC 851.14 TaxID=2219512 RepID=A0ABU9EST5_LIMFS|nr:MULTISPECIES: 4-hydroxy-tetrahydrodipicolinate synthase [Limnospira]MDY7054484.1 4-hydroxy-tetrahydrodipicolinate synthase [Limnospira fusiformis LS22]QJB24914.1 4-hydroxy-tetrahydrodipicolinate synthase [Limnospira fusiformis SAG 85.79]MDT9178788.1 4-hydroxy-tetrahydrodipicolinate synthase [Limnospira sp. PMC 1238.20]MDT9188918.1 4-hydroxy-tetrahydrodipicolinate synthase [Limnospira sp. PMC 894.15]MDT9194048.1 4-hydroxy-tetrahydrodipicolinate synthase [Limnospira sp. PMC 1245.20]
MVSFGRVMTAMVTPFWEDGSINYAEAERLAAHLAANGSDTLVVCGTTGESPTLTWDEEHELFKVVQQAVAGKAKVIAGTGSNSTQEAIAATQKAAKLGVDGSLQVVPYYNKPPQEGLYQHFLAIASACADLPIVLYNIPGRTGQNLQPETVARLASVPNIVAIKEASGSLDQASQIRQLTPKEFQIYSGDDSLTLPLLAVGGTGVVSVASHLVGKQIQDMIQMFEAGRVQEATEIHIKLFSLFKTLFITTNPIPIKAALKLLGWNVGLSRSPMCEPSPEVIEKVKGVLGELGLMETR